MSYKFTDEEFLSLYNQGLSEYRIAKILGVNHRYVRSRRRKLGLPKNHSWGPRYLHPNLEEPTTNLAYVLGVLFSDGNVYGRYVNNPSRYWITLNTIDTSFAESFANALKQIGLNPKITIITKLRGYMKKPQYQVRAISKAFCQWFKELTLEKVANLLNSDPLFLEFLRGLYEGDGYLVKCNQKQIKRGREYLYTIWRFGIINTNIKLMEIISERLRKLGFHPKLVYDKTRLGTPFVRLHLYRQNEVTQILKLLNPVIERKSYKRIENEAGASKE